MTKITSARRRRIAASRMVPRILLTRLVRLLSFMSFPPANIELYGYAFSDFRGPDLREVLFFHQPTRVFSCKRCIIDTIRMRSDHEDFPGWFYPLRFSVFEALYRPGKRRENPRMENACNRSAERSLPQYFLYFLRYGQAQCFMRLRGEVDTVNR